MRGLLPPAEAGGGCVGLQSGAHRGRVRFLCNFYSVLWNFSHGSEMRGEIWILIEKLLKCRGNTDNWDLGRILEDLERFWKYKHGITFISQLFTRKLSSKPNWLTYSFWSVTFRGPLKKNLVKVGILSQPALGYSTHIIFFMKLWIVDLWCSSILRWSCLRMNAALDGNVGDIWDLSSADLQMSENVCERLTSHINI